MDLCSLPVSSIRVPVALCPLPGILPGNRCIPHTGHPLTVPCRFRHPCRNCMFPAYPAVGIVFPSADRGVLYRGRLLYGHGLRIIIGLPVCILHLWRIRGLLSRILFGLYISRLCCRPPLWVVPSGHAPHFLRDGLCCRCGSRRRYGRLLGEHLHLSVLRLRCGSRFPSVRCCRRYGLRTGCRLWLCRWMRYRLWFQ